jgi:short-subunit dehydrogenase
MSTNKKTIFITGCGSGFGKDSTIKLAKRGHKVIATTETEAEAKKMADFAVLNKLPIESFKLDVTNEKDRELIKNFDIDVLVNNAGEGESGPLSEIPLDKVRHNFEVNVFSSIALAQLALQKMMKNDHGTVVFVSSLAGRQGIAFLGSYSMTKFALCGGIPLMRKEIARITKNVHVSLIEPGAYHTGFNQKNWAKQFVWMNENSAFFPIKEKIRIEGEKYFELFEIKTTDSLINKIVQACEAEKPCIRYSAPWWQNYGVLLLRMFRL